MRMALSIATALCLTAGSLRAQPSLHYTVDCTGAGADSLSVTITVADFPRDTAYLVFPATVPGSYEIIDAGRFAGGVAAFDGSGHPLPADRTSPNVVRIGGARRLATVTYRVGDTFDAGTETHPVAPAEGILISPDHAVVNPGVACGYFRGFQSVPITVSLVLPPDWEVATSLKEGQNTYRAATYDELADSPILAGKLDRYGFMRDKTRYEVAVNAHGGRIGARALADSLRLIIAAAESSIGWLPFERYTFLIVIGSQLEFSALEHRASSVYTLPDDDPRMTFARLAYTVPHEFLHAVTPVTLRSNLVYPFSFETPVASRHLWFYEGVTEWGAWMMRVRNGLISEEVFVGGIRELLRGSGRFDRRIGLVEASLGCYGIHADQWENVFFRGALAAMLLDMRIHELSSGRRDLQGLVRDLMKEFARDRPFSDAGFLDLLVSRTFPEVRKFLADYVDGTAPLPIAEYLLKAGYQYEPLKRTGEFENATGSWRYSAEEAGFVVRDADSVDAVNRALGIRNGDRLLRFIVGGREIPPGGGRIDAVRMTMKPGEPFTWVVDRNGKALHLTAAAGSKERVVEHAITPLAEPTIAQREFRDWWLGRRPPRANAAGR